MEVTNSNKGKEQILKVISLLDPGLILFELFLCCHQKSGGS